MKNVFFENGEKVESNNEFKIWKNEQKERRHKELVKLLKLIVKALEKK